MANNSTILFITDLYYQAKNREYYTEDLYLTSQLRDDFDIIICHPLHSMQFEEIVDLIVIRNSGPVIYYKDYFRDFFTRINTKKLPVFNALNGRGDMMGKEYLITLTEAGFPVIPTIDKVANINAIPETSEYLIKPKNGADSIGARKITRAGLTTLQLAIDIIQPFIDFEYEVSFYFINASFQYALYAPNKKERWKLERYQPDANDLAFAQRFVTWNTMTHGIQRVDACRTKDGGLLLVELEDLNPFLSLELVDNKTRAYFIDNFKNALKDAIISFIDKQKNNSILRN
jgi:hypothetical protein